MLNVSSQRVGNTHTAGNTTRHKRDQAWSFGPYFIAVIAISLIMTALFNASRGSLLLVALVHFQLNNPLYPDAQPYDSILFTILAVVIVFVTRQKMFDPDDGITDIFIPPET